MKKIRWQSFLVAFIFLVGISAGLFAVVSPTFAATKTWTGGGGDNKFSTGSNWSGGTTPTNGDAITFDVTGLGANQTLDNDITSLSLTGIHFTGTYTVQQHHYTITGNDLTISGTLLDDIVVDPNDNLYSDYMSGINVSLSGDVFDNGVWLNNIAMNGHTLTLAGRNFPPLGDDGVMIGAATGSGTIEVVADQAYMIAPGSNFTGAIIVDSGTTLNATASTLNNASSITVNDGTLWIQQILGSQQVTQPVSISGTLATTSSEYGNNSGDIFGADPVNNKLSFTGGFQLNGDLTYESGSSSGDITYLDLVTATAPYASHGHTLTIDPDSQGTMTVAGDNVPDAPTDLAATPSSAQAVLTWSAPADDGGTPITDYQVQYKKSSDVSWTTFADGTSATTGATVTGLSNGNNYDFRVAAVNAVGNSLNGTITGVAVAAPATVADAPTGLGATGGSTQAALSWTAPASNGGSAITDYQVQYKKSTDVSWTTFSDGVGTSTSTTVTGLVNGNNYDFRVAAINGVGTGAYDAVTGIAVAAPIVAPSAPLSLSATPGSTQSGLSWSAPSSDGGASITDYQVQYKKSTDASWTTFADGTSTATSTTVTGLSNGFNYDFRVAAINSVGTGDYDTVTGIAIAAAATVAGVPTGLAGVPGDTHVALNWSAPASNGGSAITDYIVEFKLSSDSSWTTFADGTSTATTATVTGLTNNSSYDFRVRAVNGVGQSTNDTITGLTPVSGATVPNAPTNLVPVIDPTTHDVTISWDAPSSDGGSSLTDYLVQIRVAGDPTWTTVTHTPFVGNSFIMTTGLTDGDTYDIQVSPINAQGTGPGLLYSGFFYNANTGATGDIGDTSGSGSSTVVGAPNTALKFIMANPLIVAIAGVVTASLFIAAAIKKHARS